MVNGRGQTVYELKEKGAGTTGDCRGKAAAENGSKEETARKTAQKAPASISKEQMASLQKELDRTGVPIETVRERYRISETGAMSEELYKKVMSALSRTKSIKAA